MCFCGCGCDFLLDGGVVGEKVTHHGLRWSFLHPVLAGRFVLIIGVGGVDQGWQARLNAIIQSLSSEFLEDFETGDEVLDGGSLVVALSLEVLGVLGGLAAGLGQGSALA